MLGVLVMIPSGEFSLLYIFIVYDLSIGDVGYFGNDTIRYVFSIIIYIIFDFRMLGVSVHVMIPSGECSL